MATKYVSDWCCYNEFEHGNLVMNIVEQEFNQDFGEEVVFEFIKYVKSESVKREKSDNQ